MRCCEINSLCRLLRTLLYRRKCFVILGISVLFIGLYFLVGNYIIRQWEIRRITSCQKNWRGGVNIGKFVTRPNSTIFLVDTSGRSTLNARQACAVESAARHNPNTKVQVLMFSPDEPNGKHISVLYEHFRNLNFTPMCPEFIFKGTPLSKWYKEGEWTKSVHWMREMSDALRYLLLWKYGGVYLDTDVIVLKRLDTMSNSIVLQDPGAIIGTSVLFFTQHHPFIQKCMKNFTNAYVYYKFASVGPTLVTNTYIDMCSSDLFTLGKRDMCDVTLLHPDTAFPVGWADYEEYINTENVQKVLKKVENSTVIHLWGKYTNAIRLKVGEGTPYELLMKKNCPSIYTNIERDNYF